MMLRRWSGRLGLLLAGLIVGAVVAEGALRLMAPDAAADLLYNAPDNAPNGLYSTDTRLFQVPTPGFRGVQDSLGYRVDLRINAQGLRGADVGAKSSPRWLAVGDSFTMAAQVSESETFTQRLAQRTGWEVLNGGVDSYGTWQALIRYEVLDETLDLDGVLLVFFAGNDVHDNMRWRQVQAEAQRLRPGQPLARRAVSPVHAWLYQNSAAYAAFRMSQRRRQLARPDHPEHNRWQSELRLFTGHGGGVLGAQMPETRRALTALAQRVAARGDRLMVVIAPPAFQIEAARLDATFSLVGLDPADARPDAVTDAVRGALDRSSIPTCDLVQPLRRAQAEGTSSYLVHDGHWSSAGHAVVSTALVDCLSREGLWTAP